MYRRDFPTLIQIGWALTRSKLPSFPIVGSFDVTNRCTLRCKHCYWWEQEHLEELSDEEYFKKIWELKKIHPTLVSAIWLGGEPLLRKDLVARCKKLFSINEVITNGTLPLPDWKDVRFAVSIDGTKKYHELQRGLNTYDRIKQNINRDDVNVNIICIITKINQQCLEKFVEEWSKTKVRSVGFGFYTPIKGKDNSKIWLDFKQRDQVLERIKLLKKDYPEFVNTPDSFLNNFHSSKCGEVTQRCRRDYAPFLGMCFDAMMKRKFPCVIGSEADCDKCGCGAATFGESIIQGKKEFIYEHLKTKIRFL